MKVLLLTIILLGICVLLLGIKVLFVKGSRFPSGHAGSSKALRERGVSCAHEQDGSGINKSINKSV